jgi:hypothetical protein
MKNVYKALAQFQQEVPPIHKGTKGYGYTYAELSQILEVINPLLKKHGLGFTQLIQFQEIKTVIFHSESAESLESLISIPQNVTLKGMNEFQVLGSAITYLRRYALSCALGIATDKDTDASGEQPQQKATQQPQQKAKIKLNALHDHYKAITTKLSKGEKTLDEVKQFYDVTECEEQLKNYTKLGKII